jgi:ATP synthase protein I
MASQDSNPDPNRRSPSGGGFSSLVEAEKLMQVAFVLPTALVLCWIGGWWLAGRTHQKWIEIAGIVFGCIVGLVYVIQMAFAVEKKASLGDGSQNETGKGSPDSKS